MTKSSLVCLICRGIQTSPISHNTWWWILIILYLFLWYPRINLAISCCLMALSILLLEIIPHFCLCLPLLGRHIINYGNSLNFASLRNQRRNNNTCKLITETKHYLMPQSISGDTCGLECGWQEIKSINPISQ